MNSTIPFLVKFNFPLINLVNFFCFINLFVIFANIGLEFAIKYPDRVRRLIFDGVALFEPQLAADMLKNYAPEITPQPNGEHFIWAWNFIKDMGVYFPHYKRDKEHYLGKEPWPTEMLHNSVVEVMKAMKHYHKGYNAVFMHKTLERLPLLQTPTLCMGHEADPLHVSVEKASSLIKTALESLYISSST